MRSFSVPAVPNAFFLNGKRPAMLSRAVPRSTSPAAPSGLFAHSRTSGSARFIARWTSRV
ncbi:hypothetical protein [Nocardia sp. MH4]|uniref:hypothetical protein n=1 Tax=Nocardia sp. MH4 TaxID=1768677 RepID=UPI001C4F1118|nr:hypothetical protein [Nocardia sp. MH4]